MKKILVVSNVCTHPTNAGNKKYILDYCNSLKNNGADVYFLYIGEKNTDDELLTQIEWQNKAYFIHLKKFDIFIGQRLISFYRRCLKRVMLDYLFVRHGIRNQYSEIEKAINPDIVLVNYYRLSKILTYSKAKTKIIVTHDCFTNKYERLGINDISMSPNIEQQYLRRSNVIMSIQEHESIFFRFLAPNIPCITIYPPIKFKKQEIVDNYNILYIASDNYLNKEGIEWFIEKIFPHVISVNPKFKLLIGGKISNSLCKYSDMTNIEIYGEVVNIDDFYKQGNIAINPTLHGTGLKIKTIEAISYGKIVITSRHSSEGLFDNKDIPTYVGDKSNDFVEIFKQVISGGHLLLEVQQQRCCNYITDMTRFTDKEINKILL